MTFISQNYYHHMLRDMSLENESCMFFAFCSTHVFMVKVKGQRRSVTNPGENEASPGVALP